MHLNCWIVKGHTITFAGISNSVNRYEITLFLPLQSLGGSERQQEGTLLEEWVIDTPVISLIWFTFCLRGKKEKELVFSSSSWMLKNVWWTSVFFVCFFGTLSFCTILKTDSITKPVAVLESASVGKHTINLERKEKDHTWQGMMQGVQWKFLLMILWRF